MPYEGGMGRGVAMAGESFPSGIICMWAGLLAEIPTGWALCDGLDGRPNLQSKFIKGAAPAAEPGDSGGSATHSHDAHLALAHAGAAVGDHAAQAHLGCAVGDHAAQSHSGAAVGDHAAHSVTQPTAHPATATAAANTGATAYGTTASSVTLKAHTHNTPVLTHTGGAVDAHSAHSVTQPTAHPILTHEVTQPSQHPLLAHVVTPPDSHAAQVHSTESNEPAYYTLAFIIKV